MLLELALWWQSTLHSMENNVLAACRGTHFQTTASDGEEGLMYSGGKEEFPPLVSQDGGGEDWGGSRREL